MAAKKKKTRKPVIFQQRLGDIFGDQMTVVCGANHAQLVAYARRHHYRHELQEWIRDNKDALEISGSHDEGRFVFCERVRGLFLVLTPYEDNWPFWENLIHELNHCVFRFAQLKFMSEETEVQARLQQFLFKQIRRKLQGIEKI